MLKVLSYATYQILGVIIMLVLLIFYPARLADIMDLNLAFMRIIGDFPQGERIEVVLRLFIGEKAFVSMEIAFVLYVIVVYFRSWWK